MISQIQKILADYHCDSSPKFIMTEKHIESWINQFEESDREFILSEFLHILKQGVYISKDRSKRLLIENLNELSSKLKYNSFPDFLRESVFIHTQIEGKSQNVLLNLLDQELILQYGISVNDCGVTIQKNYILVDDILATGKTILSDTRIWMQQQDHLKTFASNNFKFCAVLFCQHVWAGERIRWSLKKQFNEDAFTNSNKFIINSNYLIDDNKKSFKCSFNFALPIKSDLKWDTYLANIEGAVNYEDRAYRDSNQPQKEVFFSSFENRNRLEAIMLNKGIEIISKIQDESKRKNHRPLGKANPTYKTFGTGTLFFTWRNISNTCPIVFWWNNQSHDWIGLFPLDNRGNKNYVDLQGK